MGKKVRLFHVDLNAEVGSDREDARGKQPRNLLPVLRTPHAGECALKGRMGSLEPNFRVEQPGPGPVAGRRLEEFMMLEHAVDDGK